MHIESLNKTDLSNILDNAIEAVNSGEDWYAVFPKVSGYKYSIPEGYEDMERDLDTFRGSDFAIAHETVKYSDLHFKIEKLSELIFAKNIASDEVVLADIFEHAGTSYALELGMFAKQYVIQYANFLFSNDLHYECFQRFDFTGIIRKWGWSYETFYLLFVRWMSESEYASDDIDYLNYNGFPLHKGLLDDEQVVEEFFRAMKDFLVYIAYDADEEELNSYVTERFETLFAKHIYPKDEENISRMSKRFLLLLEQLKEIEKEENPEPVKNITETEDNTIPQLKRYKI